MPLNFSQLVRNRQGYINQVPAGSFAISIQASGDHYCSPRVSGLSPDQYGAFEVLVYKGKFAATFSDLKLFPKYEELMSLSDGYYGEPEEERNDALFGWVPKELLSELYDWLVEQ